MNKGARIALLIAPVLLALGAVSAVSAQDVDLLARLLQTPESTLALVALVIGVMSLTVFVRANAKATQDADRITNRILDQYEKTAGAQVQNAEAQRRVADGIYKLVGVVQTEFAGMREVQSQQAAAIRAQTEAVSQSARDFQAYQTLMDDTVYGLRESVLKLVNRIAAIEERTEQISEKAASAPGDHVRIITLLETLAKDTRQQQRELLAYLEERRGDGGEGGEGQTAA